MPSRGRSIGRSAGRLDQATEKTLQSEENVLTHIGALQQAGAV